MRNIAYLVGIVLAIGAGATFAFRESYAGHWTFLVWYGAPTIAVALLGLARAHADGVLREWITPRFGDFTRGFVACGGLFVAAWLFTRLLAPPASPRAAWLARLYMQLGDPSTRRQNLAYVIAAIIVLAIAEEIVWRGLVIALLEELIGSRRAWVWAAVLYSLTHLPAAFVLREPLLGPNPIPAAAALAAGLLWGAMRRKFERLAPGIFSHWLFDWAVTLMFPLWGYGI